MTKAELIHELTASGKLTQLFNSGLVSFRVLMYRDIYYDYQTELKRNKIGSYQAAFNVAEKYRVHVTTVYRAIKFIEQ